jgi:hypothetical protein
MTNDVTENARLEQLRLTLDTYGADRTRWPAQRRHELSQFIAASVEAQKLIADATAFDRLLDLAPTLDGARQQALLDSILKAAERTPRVVIENAPATRPVQRSNVWRWGGGAGAALAASLMLGIFAGQMGTVSSFADDMAAFAGWDTSASTQQVAQTDDSGGYFEEDLL